MRGLPIPLLIAFAGCGGGGTVRDGATVAVYVTAPLCGEAARELRRGGGGAGDVKVRVVCLPSVEEGGRIDLAQIGVNARRASEDSAAVAYIGEPTRAASRFSTPILEAADIPQLPGPNSATAMSQLLEALEQAADSGTSLRQSLNDELG